MPPNHFSAKVTVLQLQNKLFKEKICNANVSKRKWRASTAAQ